MNNKFKKINSFLMKNFAKNYCKLLIKLWEKNAKNQNYNNHVNKTVYVEKIFRSNNKFMLIVNTNLKILIIIINVIF